MTAESNAVAALFERVFTKIENDRMSDIPIINKALNVQSVGFREWNGMMLGVLITPWFMSLILKPVANNADDESSNEQPRAGSKIVYNFPSGDYEFICGEEEEIGHYQSCSLFSPLFEFSDQETAVATAQEVMAALMDEENIDPSGNTKAAEIAKAWTEDKTLSADNEGKMDVNGCENPEIDANEPIQTLEERMEQPVSRRNLFRGLLGERDIND